MSKKNKKQDGEEEDNAIPLCLCRKYQATVCGTEAARTATARNAFRCKSEVDILFIHESIFATLD
jgi:hypothetical protein